MKFGETLKIIVLAWVCPLVLVVTVHLFTPNPNLPKESYPSATFVPSDIRMVEKEEARGADYFELWLHNPNGESYFHRDPNPGPITALKHKIPQGKPLMIIYSPTSGGNVLLEIRATESQSEPALSFETVMSEHAFRRRLVHILAGAWFTIGTLCFYVARRQATTLSEHSSPA